MALPKTFDFTGKSVGQPARAFRTTVSPSNGGSSFATGKVIQLHIPSGSPGVFLDGPSTYLQYTLNNQSENIFSSSTRTPPR
jgi:hypothetical protein